VLPKILQPHLNTTSHNFHSSCSRVNTPPAMQVPQRTTLLPSTSTEAAVNDTRSRCRIRDSLQRSVKWLRSSVSQAWKLLEWFSFVAPLVLATVFVEWIMLILRRLHCVIVCKTTSQIPENIASSLLPPFQITSYSNFLGESKHLSLTKIIERITKIYDIK
jgi:hypothetical protein